MSSSPRREMRLTSRLVAWISALMALTLLTFAGATLLLTSRDLHARLDQQVLQAAQRSMQFSRGGGPHGGARAPRDPMDAPGQGAGVLTVVRQDGSVVSARRQDSDGDVVSLSARDLSSLDAAGAFAPPVGAPDVDGHGPPDLRTVALEAGEYRVATQWVPVQGQAEQVLVTGLPTASVTGPLATLALVEGLGILAALAIAATVATTVIRRSLKPLEAVSDVASRIAGLPLDDPRATLPADRVPAPLAVPGTEVGNVGSALNHLLDNVSTALVARQRSEQSLRDFVADASHELRTPLASVRGYADMMRLTEDLSPEGRQSLARVESQAVRMNGIVDDLLLLARLESGQQSAASEVELGELVAEAVMDAQVAGRDHRWVAHVDAEPTVVRADARQVGQVVANLLSNARKHTPAGTTVTTRLGHDGPEAVLTVSDDGPGIDPRFRDKLFERFTRADVQRSRSASGEGSSGLGLAIVAAIVEHHGGTVSCRSQVAAEGTPGTVFTVRLPLAAGYSSSKR